MKFLLPLFLLLSFTLHSAPVVVSGDTLFSIYTHSGAFTPEDRAKNVAHIITQISEKYASSPDTLQIIEEDGDYNVKFHTTTIVSINQSEAEAHHTTQLALSQSIKQIINKALYKHYYDNTTSHWLTRIALSLLILIVAIVLFRLLKRFHNKVRYKVASLKGSKLKGITFKTYKLLNEEQEQRIVLSLVIAVKYILYIAIVYTAITLLLSIFPHTKGIANTLWGYVINPLISMGESVLSYLPNLVKIIIIVIVFRYIIKLLHLLANEIHNGKITLAGFYSDWALPTFNIIRALLLIFCVIEIFPLLPGSDSDTFKGISVFVGIVVSLGSTNLIGNMVAGLVLTYMRPFQIGDMVKICDVTGNVIEKTPFVVRIRTQKKEEITIPNSQILTNHTLNYTKSAENTKVIIYSTVRISYDKNWEEVHSLLIKAAEQTPRVLDTPKPFVQQSSLSNFYVEYQINAYISEVDKLSQIYSDLHQNIQSIFNASDIELISPDYLTNRQQQIGE
ncbi:MAG: mechanosensitive ion channel family protein [Ignavibacteria bacterium]|jgi:small-conductance mechanosensitive channel|nr:mechanosensitive ion channel family protein [Ignavibacteria bacterium]